MWPFNCRLVIPKTFDDCLSYGQQVAFLAEKVIDLEERVKALEEKVDPEEEPGT
jgi:hypothetical protein